MAHYSIEVKGEIFSTGGVQYAQCWACKSKSHYNTNNECYSYSYDKDTHTVKSDLILTEKRRAVPYASYFTEKGIAVNLDSADKFYFCRGCGAALGYYRDNIRNISSQLKCDIPKEIEQTFFHGLFTDIFSTLELFLSDFILCMIYTNETVYDKAVLYYKTSKQTQNEVSEIEKKVHNFFFNGIVYHKFDKVKDIYTQLLDIEFPDTEGLRNFLHKRNNIVHRFSFSNIDRMEIITITKKTIEDLIKEMNLFVNKLVENVKAKYPEA